MVCSRSAREPSRNREGGFATPAAVVISLALATIAVAYQLSAVAALHASQADYVRAGAELRLDGAQAIAASELSSGQQARDGRWSLELNGVSIQVRAEPEAAKLSYVAAAALNPDVLAQLGASHPGRVQRGLSQLAGDGQASPEQLSGLDGSPAWRACAARVISAYGQAVAFSASAESDSLQARLGQVWRVRVSDGWGWTDTRTARFVGDGSTPVRTIFRRFSRNRSGDPPCPRINAPAA